MQIKSSIGVSESAFGGDLTTRLEELAQKTREKASALKTNDQTNGQDAAAEQAAAAEKLDFTNAQDRSTFLASLQGGNESLEMQHSLDLERVRQLLEL